MNPALPLFILAFIFLVMAVAWYFNPPYQGAHEAGAPARHVPAPRPRPAPPVRYPAPPVSLVRPYVRHVVALEPGREIESMTETTDRFIARMRG